MRDRAAIPGQRHPARAADAARLARQGGGARRRRRATGLEDHRSVAASRIAPPARERAGVRGAAREPGRARAAGVRRREPRGGGGDPARLPARLGARAGAGRPARAARRSRARLLRDGAGRGLQSQGAVRRARAARLARHDARRGVESARAERAARGGGRAAARLAARPPGPRRLPPAPAAALAAESGARAPSVLLAAAGALLLGSQPGLVGRAASDWLLACSAMTLGTLLLAVALALQRFALTPPPSAAPAGAPAPGRAR